VTVLTPDVQLSKTEFKDQPILAWSLIVLSSILLGIWAVKGTIALRNGVATVQAGGGVVADSTGEFEYQECISKASAPLLALELVDPLS